MSTRLLEARPSPGTDPRSRSRTRTIGLTLGVVGIALVTVTLVAAIAAGVLVGRSGEEATVARLLAWSFGLTTTAFGTLKLGIGVILVAILIRLWLRVDAVKEALPPLKPAGRVDTPGEIGPIQTPYGMATAAAVAPKPLTIHRMARALWAPMLAMGGMAIVAGFVVSLVQVDSIGSDAALARSQSAWVQGLQFLGEGFVLSGISLLLGTILGSLRAGGVEVQGFAGTRITSLDMPPTGKLFIGLMALGLAVEVFQFVVYAVVATFDDAQTVAVYFTWLGPVRESGLGILLSGIVLALATIARALGFQFWRLAEIVRTGR